MSKNEHSVKEYYILASSCCSNYFILLFKITFLIFGGSVLLHCHITFADLCTCVSLVWPSWTILIMWCNLFHCILLILREVQLYFSKLMLEVITKLALMVKIQMLRLENWKFIIIPRIYIFGPKVQLYWCCLVITSLCFCLTVFMVHEWKLPLPSTISYGHLIK